MWSISSGAGTAVRGAHIRVWGSGAGGEGGAVGVMERQWRARCPACSISLMGVSRTPLEGGETFCSNVW